MEPNNRSDSPLSSLYMDELINQVLSTWDNKAFWTMDPISFQTNPIDQLGLSLLTDTKLGMDHSPAHVHCTSISDQSVLDENSCKWEMDHQGTLRRSCKLCGVGFSRKYDLARHMTTNHANNKAGYECSVCFKTFGRKDTLTRHCDTVHKMSRRKH
mmetsp:Transcript_9239/g.16135  ORF Transcript_9239/g.16135 Transcript_9239/m.16135 type:complete len:156 (+) Transcript_9239:144-611(+)